MFHTGSDMFYSWPKCQDPTVEGSSKTSQSQATGKDSRGVRCKMYCKWEGGPHTCAFQTMAHPDMAQNILLDILFHFTRSFFGLFLINLCRFPMIPSFHTALPAVTMPGPTSWRQRQSSKSESAGQQGGRWKMFCRWIG